VAPQDPEAAAAEIKRATGALNLNGVVINSHSRGEYLDAPRYEPIFAAAQAGDVPIYLHPSLLPAGAVAPYLDYGLMAAMWGYAADASLHALRIILAGTFDRFPRARMVLGHLGEHFTVSTSGMNHAPASIGFCVDQLGADRVMFAGDYPFEVLQPEVAAFAQVPLSESERAALCHGNAERVFGL
jgi:5-carboxyvanillate decarboxylase